MSVRIFSCANRPNTLSVARSREEPHGVIVTCLISIGGALAGGWLAAELFHIHSLQGFFNLFTWVTAIVGSVVLFGAVHLVEGQNSGRGSLRGGRRSVRAGRR